MFLSFWHLYLTWNQVIFSIEINRKIKIQKAEKHNREDATLKNS